MKHDWYRSIISLKKGDKNRYIEFGRNEVMIRLGLLPIYEETFNIAKGLEVEAERQLLKEK